MVAVPIALDAGARVTGMREGETRVARVNRAAFQPFRRCERSRISFFVSGNGTFLSNRPENLCLAVDLRPCRRECPSPPPGSIYWSCNNSKISVYFTGGASNFRVPTLAA